ncbi:MAG: serine/threonine-protein kinase [Myxococcota bacterium]|nr:serine/threonine-protein kinase [Myxococcota bacterium]
MTDTHGQAGRIVQGKYQLLEEIGSGANGTVYKAVQHPVGRTVAIKFISRHLSRELDNRARFFDEAKALARVNHPSVVTLYDFGESEGQLFMVMEFVEGEELAAVINREGAINGARVIELAKQLLGALVETHELGLIHRDLKPANMMVFRSGTGEERIKILDFGLAILRDDPGGGARLHETRRLGTPGYCAPEQCVGRPIRPSTDLYALGVVLYEMLTGVMPFRGKTPWMVIEQHLNQDVPKMPQSLAVPDSLESLVRLAMAKKPEARFPDARSMLTRLLEIETATEPSISYSLPTLRDMVALNGPRLARLARQFESYRKDVASATSNALSGRTTQDIIGVIPHASTDGHVGHFGLMDTLDLDRPFLMDAVNHSVSWSPTYEATTRGHAEEQPLRSTVCRSLTVNALVVVSIIVMLSVFSNYA